LSSRASLAEFIRFWDRLEADSGSWVHPDDVDVLKNSGRAGREPVSANFRVFLETLRFNDFAKTDFDFGLLPQPYLRNLARADIFLLMLNPGLSLTDRYAEHHLVPDIFRNRMIGTLKQEFTENDFPFLFLDPSLCWHSGFAWWESKLHDLARAYSKACDCGYRDGLRRLSDRVAVIELVPYHSFRFRDAGLFTKKRGYLSSSENAMRFVRNALVPGANEGEVLIVVARGANRWALEPVAKNIVVLCGGEARGAHLSPKTPAGRAILGHLLSRRP
jgi:hypothetical protein